MRSETSDACKDGLSKNGMENSSTGMHRDQVLSIDLTSRMKKQESLDERDLDMVYWRRKSMT